MRGCCASIGRQQKAFDKAAIRAIEEISEPSKRPVPNQPQVNVGCAAPENFVSKDQLQHVTQTSLYVVYLGLIGQIWPAKRLPAVALHIVRREPA